MHQGAYNEEIENELNLRELRGACIIGRNVRQNVELASNSLRTNSYIYISRRAVLHIHRYTIPLALTITRLGLNPEFLMDLYLFHAETKDSWAGGAW